MKRSAELATLVPAVVVTDTSTVPLPGGEVATIVVGPLAVIVPAVPPNLTAVAPAKLLPVIVTLVPPALGPLVGEIPVTAGNVV